MGNEVGKQQQYAVKGAGGEYLQRDRAQLAIVREALRNKAASDEFGKVRKPRKLPLMPHQNRHGRARRRKSLRSASTPSDDVTPSTQRSVNDDGVKGDDGDGGEMSPRTYGPTKWRLPSPTSALHSGFEQNGGRFGVDPQLETAKKSSSKQQKSNDKVGSWLNKPTNQWQPSNHESDYWQQSDHSNNHWEPRDHRTNQWQASEPSWFESYPHPAPFQQLPPYFTFNPHHMTPFPVPAYAAGPYEPPMNGLPTRSKSLGNMTEEADYSPGTFPHMAPTPHHMANHPYLPYLHHYFHHMNQFNHQQAVDFINHQQFVRGEPRMRSKSHGNLKDNWTDQEGRRKAYQAAQAQLDTGRDVMHLAPNQTFEVDHVTHVRERVTSQDHVTSSDQDSFSDCSSLNDVMIDNDVMMNASQKPEAHHNFRSISRPSEAIDDVIIGNDVTMDAPPEVHHSFRAISSPPEAVDDVIASGRGVEESNGSSPDGVSPRSSHHSSNSTTQPKRVVMRLCESESIVASSFVTRSGGKVFCLTRSKSMAAPDKSAPPSTPPRPTPSPRRSISSRPPSESDPTPPEDRKHPPPPPQRSASFHDSRGDPARRTLTQELTSIPGGVFSLLKTPSPREESDDPPEALMEDSSSASDLSSSPSSSSLPSPKLEDTSRHGEETTRLDPPVSSRSLPEDLTSASNHQPPVQNTPHIRKSLLTPRTNPPLSSRSAPDHPTSHSHLVSSNPPQRHTDHPVKENNVQKSSPRSHPPTPPPRGQMTPINHIPQASRPPTEQRTTIPGSDLRQTPPPVVRKSPRSAPDPPPSRNQSVPANHISRVSHPPTEQNSSTPEPDLRNTPSHVVRNFPRSNPIPPVSGDEPAPMNHVVKAFHPPTNQNAPRLDLRQTPSPAARKSPSSDPLPPSFNVQLKHVSPTSHPPRSDSLPPAFNVQLRHVAPPSSHPPPLRRQPNADPSPPNRIPDEDQPRHPSAVSNNFNSHRREFDATRRAFGTDDVTTRGRDVTKSQTPCAPANRNIHDELRNVEANHDVIRPPSATTSSSDDSDSDDSCDVVDDVIDGVTDDDARTTSDRADDDDFRFTSGNFYTERRATLPSISRDSTTREVTSAPASGRRSPGGGGGGGGGGVNPFLHSSTTSDFHLKMMERARSEEQLRREMSKSSEELWSDIRRSEERLRRSESREQETLQERAARILGIGSSDVGRKTPLTSYIGLTGSRGGSPASGNQSPPPRGGIPSSETSVVTKQPQNIPRENLREKDKRTNKEQTDKEHDERSGEVSSVVTKQSPRSDHEEESEMSSSRFVMSVTDSMIAHNSLYHVISLSQSATTTAGATVGSGGDASDDDVTSLTSSSSSSSAAYVMNGGCAVEYKLPDDVLGGDDVMRNDGMTSSLPAPGRESIIASFAHNIYDTSPTSLRNSTDTTSSTNSTPSSAHRRPLADTPSSNNSTPSFAHSRPLADTPSSTNSTPSSAHRRPLADARGESPIPVASGSARLTPAEMDIVHQMCSQAPPAARKSRSDHEKVDAVARAIGMTSRSPSRRRVTSQSPGLTSPPRRQLAMMSDFDVKVVRCNDNAKPEPEVTSHAPEVTSQTPEAQQGTEVRHVMESLGLDPDESWMVAV